MTGIEEPISKDQPDFNNQTSLRQSIVILF